MRIFFLPKILIIDKEREEFIPKWMAGYLFDRVNEKQKEMEEFKIGKVDDTLIDSFVEEDARDRWFYDDSERDNFHEFLWGDKKVVEVPKHLIKVDRDATIFSKKDLSKYGDKIQGKYFNPNHLRKIDLNQHVEKVKHLKATHDHMIFAEKQPVDSIAFKTYHKIVSNDINNWKKFSCGTSKNDAESIENDSGECNLEDLDKMTFVEEVLLQDIDSSNLFF